MALFQREFDHLTAENELLRSTAKPSIVPKGDTYASIKDLLEYIGDGATDKNITDLANAVTISIFGQRGLSLSGNKSTPLVTAINKILTRMETGKAINAPKRAAAKPCDQEEDSKRQKK